MKKPIIALALLALLAVTLVLSLATGTADIAASEVLRIIASAGAAEGIAEYKNIIVWEVRFPRALVALLGGAGLAVAGAAMQGLFRNPMADPGIIGVSAGAAFGAVTGLYVASSAVALWLVPSLAFLFALVAAFSVYALSTSRGRTPVTTLLLSGIAVSGIASALTSLVLSVSLSDWEIGREMLTWLMGGLEGRGWSHFALILPLVVGGTLWLASFHRDLDALAIGDDNALSVGVDVQRSKRIVLLAASLVTAGTVAVMGIVGFVGLMVPHIARKLVGAQHRHLIITSALLGALMLLLADLLVRSLPLSDLRLGVVTALTGGPFFLYLLIRHRRRLG